MNALAKAQTSEALPHDLEAEQAVLGAMLLNNESWYGFGDRLKADHFYEPLHRRIYACAADLIADGKEASPTTLMHRLGDDAALTEVGGRRYLANLAGGAFAVASPPVYAQIVHDLAQRRAIIEAADAIKARAFDTRSVDSDAVVADAQRRLDALSDGGGTVGADLVGDFADEAMAAAQRAAESDRIPGTSYGLSRLNGLTGGMFPGDLILCAGRPGMGKTALATNIAQAACEQGKAVIFISLEMVGAQTSLRLMSQLSYASPMRFAYEAARRGKLNPMEWSSLEESRGLLKSWPLRIEERRGLTVADIKIAVRRRARAFEKAGYPLGLIIVDHLGLVRGEGFARMNRAVELGEMTSGLRTLAGDIGTPLLLLAQLNREVERRDNRRPYLADLRDSGRVEEDADVVLLLYRPEYYALKQRPDRERDPVGYAEWESNFEPVKGLFEIQIAKQRNGPEGVVHAWCDMAFNVVRDYAP